MEFKIKDNERLNEHFPAGTTERTELQKLVRDGNVAYSPRYKRATVSLGHRLFMFFTKTSPDGSIVWLDYDNVVT